MLILSDFRILKDKNDWPSKFLGLHCEISKDRLYKLYFMYREWKTEFEDTGHVFGSGEQYPHFEYLELNSAFLSTTHSLS